MARSEAEKDSSENISTDFSQKIPTDARTVMLAASSNVPSRPRGKGSNQITSRNTNGTGANQNSSSRNGDESGSENGPLLHGTKPRPIQCLITPNSPWGKGSLFNAQPPDSSRPTINNGSLSPSSEPWGKADNTREGTPPQQQGQASRGSSSGEEGGVTVNVAPPPNAWEMRAASRTAQTNSTGAYPGQTSAQSSGVTRPQVQTSAPQTGAMRAQVRQNSQNRVVKSQSQAQLTNGMRSKLQTPSVVRSQSQNQLRNAMSSQPLEPQPNIVKSNSQNQLRNALRTPTENPQTNAMTSQPQIPQTSAIRPQSQHPQTSATRSQTQSQMTNAMRSQTQTSTNLTRSLSHDPQTNSARSQFYSPQANAMRSQSQSPQSNAPSFPFEDEQNSVTRSQSQNQLSSTMKSQTRTSQTSVMRSQSQNQLTNAIRSQTQSSQPMGTRSPPQTSNSPRSPSQSPQPTNNANLAPPIGTWTGGKTSPPGKDSPRGRGVETDAAPPTSPRGKDCSANSDCSGDDAELEALEHLPDRVLMFNKRDPVSVLMEYGQTREVKVGFTDVSRSGPHHASRFHTAATVDGETYALATGTSKKCAKKAAAIITLRTLYDRGMTNLSQANVNVNLEMNEMDATEPMAHSTKIMHISRRMLEMAEETQFINYSKDKVLATVVLERRGKYTVAGLGTGNRCIQYQHLATDGSRVIHSHAEVIARRAFIRYILKELISYKSTEKHALLARSRHSGLIKLHDDVKVHLYISRPPCGDAAAFPTITNFPNRMRAIRKQGQLRTIIDDGEGAIPTDFPLPANANGKERLRVMTCSDKILRWNGVGIQGGLLSNFMDPVYLNSLVIGSHTGDQRGHVPRAISGRLKCGRLHEVLSKPFRICSPEIVYPPCSDNYAITKSKQYCITWSEGDPDAEVIDAVTGSVAMEPTAESPSSRVSKRSLLALFRAACDNLNASPLAAMSYCEAKQASRAYQHTKAAVEDHLLSCGFGQWLSLQDTYGTDNFEEHEKL